MYFDYIIRKIKMMLIANYKPNSRFPDFYSDFRSDLDFRSETIPDLKQFQISKNYYKIIIKPLNLRQKNHQLLI